MRAFDLGLTPTDYFRLELRPERDVLLLVFSHLNEPAGRFTLLRTVTSIGAHAVLTNTPERSYYALGVPGLGEDVAGTVAGLKRLIAELRPGAVATLGISMGGYAALLFAALLGVDRALALSPETLLMLPESRSRGVLAGRIVPPFPDLLPLMRDASRTRFALYFGECELHDVHAALRVAPLPNVRCVSVQGTGHEVGRWLAAQRLLEPLVDGFTHHGRLIEDFPGRGRVLEHAPAIELAMRATAHLAARAPAAALPLLSEAVRVSPGFDLGHDALGRALLDLGRPSEAARACRCAADLAPEWDAYRLRYGRALLAAGELDEAERVLAAVAAEHPRWGLAQHCLGLAAARRGEPARAIAAQRQAVASGERNASYAYHLGALLWAAGETSEAEAALRQAVALNPRQSFLQAQLAKLLLITRRPEAALPPLREAIALAPDNAEYRQMLAEAEASLAGRPGSVCASR